MGVIDQKELREFLQDTLTQGRLRNPSFSLRELAQKAGLSPAALSEILNGKRKVTTERAAKILTKMSVSPEKSDFILKSLNSYGTAKHSQQQLSIDQFYLVADWYHFAILSLAETEGFNDSPEWISKRLNIPIPITIKAIERLERLGALKRNEKGHLMASGTQLTTPDEIANRGLKQQHAEILELCKNSLDKDSIHERDFLGVTLTMNPKDLPLAKKMLREFVSKFCTKIEKGEKKEVYRLNLQLIPLSENN
jgi:transcriptional regulator with XRE-family HTH domain